MMLSLTSIVFISTTSTADIDSTLYDGWPSFSESWFAKTRHGGAGGFRASVGVDSDTTSGQNGWFAGGWTWESDTTYHFRLEYVASIETAKLFVEDMNNNNPLCSYVVGPSFGNIAIVARSAPELAMTTTIENIEFNTCSLETDSFSVTSDSDEDKVKHILIPNADISSDFNVEGDFTFTYGDETYDEAPALYILIQQPHLECVSFLKEDDFNGVDDDTSFWSQNDALVNLQKHHISILEGCGDVYGFEDTSDIDFTHRGTRGLGIETNENDEVDSIDGLEHIKVVFDYPVYLNKFEIRSLFANEGGEGEQCDIDLFLHDNLVESYHLTGVESLGGGNDGDVVQVVGGKRIDTIIFYIDETKDYVSWSEFALSRLCIFDLQPPTADANGPYYAECNNDFTIMLDGTKSSDPDGNIVNWTWEFETGEKIYGENPSFSFVPKEHESYEVEVLLTVTDNDGFIDTDSTTIFVGSFDNDPPIIQLITPKENSIVNGVTTVKWYAIDDGYPRGQGIPIYLYYKSVNSDSWHRINGVFTNNLDAEHGDCHWDTNTLADGEYLFKAEASDKSGNIDYDTALITINNANAGTYITNVEIMDTTLASNYFVKNNDDIEIIATISQTQVFSIEQQDITADLSGFGLGTNITAESFNGLIATWTINDVECTPLNGEIIVTVSVGDDICEDSIVADNIDPEITFEKPAAGLYLFDHRILPLNKAVVVGGIDVDVTVIDEGIISQVEYYVDGKLITAMNKDPFGWNCNLKGWNGLFVLDAVVYDGAGNQNTASQKILLFNPYGQNW